MMDPGTECMSITHLKRRELALQLRSFSLVNNLHIPTATEQEQFLNQLRMQQEGTAIIICIIRRRPQQRDRFCIGSVCKVDACQQNTGFACAWIDQVGKQLRLWTYLCHPHSE